MKKIMKNMVVIIASILLILSVFGTKIVRADDTEDTATGEVIETEEIKETTENTDDTDVLEDSEEVIIENEDNNENVVEESLEDNEEIDLAETEEIDEAAKKSYTITFKAGKEGKICITGYAYPNHEERYYDEISITVIDGQTIGEAIAEFAKKNIMNGADWGDLSCVSNNEHRLCDGFSDGTNLYYVKYWSEEARKLVCKEHGLIDAHDFEADTVFRKDTVLTAVYGDAYIVTFDAGKNSKGFPIYGAGEGEKGFAYRDDIHTNNVYEIDEFYDDIIGYEKTKKFRVRMGCSIWNECAGLDDSGIEMYMKERYSPIPEEGYKYIGWREGADWRLYSLDPMFVTVDNEEYYDDRFIPAHIFDKDTTLVASYVSTRVSDEKDTIIYRTHIQSYGWSNYSIDGEVSGTVGEGKRLEGIDLMVTNHPYDGDLEYRTHVQSYGWQDWKQNGAISGTSGQAKRLEAIQIRLTGEMAKHYDVYYRVQAQTYGWLGWAKNGEYSGTAGLAKRLEAIQVVLVDKGKAIDKAGYDKLAGITASTKVTPEKAYITKTPDIMYRTHVQTFGWQGFVSNGLVSGTTGQSKRLEGIEIKLGNLPYEGGVRYKTHVQTYGWQGWKQNGAMSGTSGESKRLEAISIELTGELAKHYDVYYRVHAQTYGWLGWAKNGQNSGTAGKAKRLEGIQIILVEKGQPAPGKTYNGITANRNETYISN